MIGKMPSNRVPYIYFPNAFLGISSKSLLRYSESSLRNIVFNKKNRTIDNASSPWTRFEEGRPKAVRDKVAGKGQQQKH
jgi:hypothetical protein